MRFILKNFFLLTVGSSLLSTPAYGDGSKKETISVVLAEDYRMGERGLSAGSDCDECIALALDKEQNEADGNPQPAIMLTSARTAETTSSVNEVLLKQISKGFSTVAKKANPAVVYIETHVTEKMQKLPRQNSPFENPFDSFQDDFFNRFFGFPYQQQPQQKPRRQETLRGSGFLVTEDGYIVTNNHVVDNATKVSVSFMNGKKTTAKVVGTDPKTDLAVIKIDETGLPHLKFADSEKIEVGDWAIAIGNPFGLQATVTVGVVSAKGRSHLHIADFEDFIQTDAAINPGNSGGPLLDIEGEVIGVNTAIVSGSGGYMGIGFAIPSNMAKEIVNQLMENGEVTRGFLGVTLQPIDHDLADFYKLKSTNGALVADVLKDSPAEKGGLKQEDIILSYNGTPVKSLSSFRNYVSLLAPGSKLSLVVSRDGKEKTLHLTVAESPGDSVGQDTPVRKLGLKVENLTPESAQQLNYPNDKGVVITEVETGTPAAEAALRPGALILAVNRKKVETLDQFSKAISEAAEEGRVLLMVKQGSAIRFVALHFN